jgi:hypothetical protein
MSDRPGIEHNRQMTADLVAQAAVAGVQTWDWPNPRPSWSPEVQQSYEAYKRDVSAKAAREVDVATVFRYFDVLEIQARLFEEIIGLATLVSDNSAGTMVVDPRINAFARMVTVGVKLASEIGATPISRVKLGLYAVEGQTATIALEREINRMSDVPVQVELDGAEIVMSW